MKYLLAAILVTFAVVPAFADDTNLHGRWSMTVVQGDVLEDLASDFHYIFQPDGVLVTQTPFANYDGTWSVDVSGQVTLVLMSAMPSASNKFCDYEIVDDALQISNCNDGSPAAGFARAE